MLNLRRRLRGLVGNAVLWGIGWAILGFLVSLMLTVTGVIPGISVLDSLGMGIRVGIVGAIAGTVFSTYIALAYRGRRIENISWVKFGLGGAVVTTVVLPLMMQIFNILSGDGLAPWSDIRDDLLIFAVFGGGAAALSMKLAQIAARRAPDAADGSLGAAENDQVGSGGVEIPLKQRTPAPAERI